MVGTEEGRQALAAALRAAADALVGKLGARRQNIGDRVHLSEGGNSPVTNPPGEPIASVGSIGAEMMAAPLEMAATAVGAMGEAVTGALGETQQDGGNPDVAPRRRSSRRKNESK